MRTAARCALAFIQRWQDVPLFSLSILIFVKFTPVIVVSPAYGVEFIKVGIEGVAKSREVLVPKNISITDQPISEDGCPLINLPIIRQPGCYLREKFRFGRTARTDYLALEKITLQHRIMTLVRHRITGDTYKVYLSDNSRGSPIIVEPIANMFRIFDTLRRRDGDDSVSICGIYNNKNEWSLCSVEHLFGDECGFQGRVGGFFSDGDRRLHVSRLHFGGILSGGDLVLGCRPQSVSGHFERKSEISNCAGGDSCNQCTVAVQKFNRLPSRIEEYIVTVAIFICVVIFAYFTLEI